MAPFQSEVELPSARLVQLAAAPEWYLIIGALGAVSLLGTLWTPLLAAVPLVALSTAAAFANALGGVRSAAFGVEGRRCGRRLILQAVTFALHLLQPAARLAGRLGHGLVPWRRPRLQDFTAPIRRERELWSETWQAPEHRLSRVEAALRDHGGRVRIGGPCDRWEMQVAGGALGAARLRTAVEDHGRGRQLLRLSVWPRVPRSLVPVVTGLGLAGAVAADQQAWVVAALLATLAVALATASVFECGIATAGALRASAAAVHDGPRIELAEETER